MLVRFPPMNAIPPIPQPVNEPVLTYGPGTSERAALKQALKDLAARVVEIPVVVGGKEVRTGNVKDVTMPHCHGHVLARVHQAGPAELDAAVAAAQTAWREWSRWSLEQRAAVFLRAADLLATRYRAAINAATMLGQSKTANQAEIDAACEMVDFLRFNVHFAQRLYQEQPLSVPGQWNRMEVICKADTFTIKVNGTVVNRAEKLTNTRGRILDRKGRVLALNRPSYDIAVDYRVITGQWAFDQARALRAGPRCEAAAASSMR